MSTQSRRVVKVPNLYNFDKFTAMLSISDVGGVVLLREEDPSSLNGLQGDWERLSNDWLSLTNDYGKACKKLEQELEKSRAGEKTS